MTGVNSCEIINHPANYVIVFPVYVTRALHGRGVTCERHGKLRSFTLPAGLFSHS